MSAPYKIGDRVVCPDPGGRWFVGVVDRLLFNGDFVITDGAGFFRVSASEVRPVMPRDRADLERWGRWWYLDSEVVEVAIRAAGLFIWRTGVDDGCAAGLDADWRGPVAPPPEVRP